MFNVLRPRKRASRFGNHTDELKRKSVRVYYIIEDKMFVYTNNTTNYKINNFVLISIFYRSAVDDPIHGAI